MQGRLEQPLLSFHGAAGTVTGSRHLLQVGEERILVDCGIFQGPRALREMNWRPFPVPPGAIDSVVLTHAHLDHSGYLPGLVKEGFRGTIHCTNATRDLLPIMLLDSARIQVEEAQHANRHEWSRHKPALPLYDEEDVARCLPLLQGHGYHEAFEPVRGVQAHFLRAGHILGSAFVNVQTPSCSICFGGDLGRYGQSIIPDPTPVSRADYLLLESTYGNRDHADTDPSAFLQRVVLDAVANRGFVLIPSFAIGRTQELLYLLNDLVHSGRIPQVPVFVDSPMAISAIPLFARHREDHDLEMASLIDASRCPFEGPGVRLVQSREESKAINEERGPGIIIAGSGMVNGGRIRHHLLNRIGDPRNTLLFVGYQGEGTPGRAILDGARTFRAFGWEVPIALRVERIDALSAHADRGEIMRWLADFEDAPRRTFLVHGEDDARQALQAKITAEKGWSVYSPSLHETVPLV